MRRLAVIALVFLAFLAGAVALAVSLDGPRALAAGRRLYDYRGALVRASHRRGAPPGPYVAWLGDSTILGRSSWVPQVEAQVLAPAGIASSLVAWFGLDFYQYYFLLGPVLEQRPALVVAVANLRMFRSHRDHAFNDLAALVPAAELPRALFLPLGERGLTMPRLLLARTLRLARGERAMLFFEGLRRRFQDLPAWQALGASRPGLDRELVERRYEEAGLALLKSYDAPLRRRQPVVRMLAEVVRMATAANVPVLIVVSPIPYQQLAAHGWYDRRAYAERIALLRAVTEENGGRLLDLHDAVAADEFHDQSGHFTPTGAQHVARLVVAALPAPLGAGF